MKSKKIETKKDRQVKNPKEIDTRVERYIKDQTKDPLLQDYRQEEFQEKLNKHKHKGIHITDE